MRCAAAGHACSRACSPASLTVCASSSLANPTTSRNSPQQQQPSSSSLRSQLHGEMRVTAGPTLPLPRVTATTAKEPLPGPSLTWPFLPPSSVHAPNHENSSSPALPRLLVAPLFGTLAALLVLAGPLGPAAARIPTEAMLSDVSAGERAAVMQLAAPPAAVVTPAGPSGAGGVPWSALEGGPRPGPARAPGTMVGTPNYARGPSRREGSRSTASEAAEALQLLTSARDAVDGGLHDQALELYGRLVTEHADLALAEYGRIGRAMMLYQVGRTSDSILAMEDEEVSMRGAAEVHAALAALLYSERPSLALRAEEEWNLACLFDKRYANPDWVRANKHWPPRMIAALQKFLSLA